MFAPPTLRPGTGADAAVLVRRAVAFGVDLGAWLLLTALPGLDLPSTATVTTATLSYGG